jgi:hypothetical protein
MGQGEPTEEDIVAGEENGRIRARVVERLHGD